MTAIRTPTLLAAGLICLAATASTAHAADPYSVSLSGPSSGTVGSPVVLQASGENPVDESHITLDVHVIPTSVTPTCPGDFLNSMSISSRVPGGDWVATAQQTGAGPWSKTLAYTPGTAGSFIVCGYTHDISYTLGTASLPLVVNAASAPAPTAPAPGGSGGGGQQPVTPGTPAPIPGDTGAGGVALAQTSRATRRYTRFSKLAVSGVPAGSKVVATCRYRRKKCSGKARRTFTRKNAAGRVSLSSFTRVKLKPSTVIKVTVTGADGSRTKQTIKIRAGKAPRIS